jgi:hypothetical protein
MVATYLAGVPSVLIPRWDRIWGSSSLLPQWVPGSLSPEIKRPKREADNSHPPSTEVKNAWNYTSTPPVRLHGMVLS